MFTIKLNSTLRSELSKFRDFDEEAIRYVANDLCRTGRADIGGSSSAGPGELQLHRVGDGVELVFIPQAAIDALHNDPDYIWSDAEQSYHKSQAMYRSSQVVLTKWVFYAWEAKTIYSFCFRLQEYLRWCYNKVGC